MKQDYKLLSLDPMYSPLHERIAQLIASERYAVTSCIAKKVYLPSYQLHLATELIHSVTTKESKIYHPKIKQLKTYHHSFVEKKQHRELNNQEIDYMARFYLAIKAFIIDKKIDLVLIHNDSRWYHAIVIDICKDLAIPYLVTEQGLIRPYTTIIDSKGLSINSDIKFDGYNPDISEQKFSDISVKDKHDSFKSMFFFLLFLSCFTVERLMGNKTILRYMHNNYSLRKYAKRIVNRVRPRVNVQEGLPASSALLLLQLDYDSQILLYSPFSSNQDVIELVEKIAKANGLKLAIKKHPLDQCDYKVQSESFFVSGKVKKLAEEAEIVFTVNSSASIDVMRTSTPLLLLGKSIYDQPSIASNYTDLSGSQSIKEVIEDIDLVKRKNFIDYLQNDYLIKGSGYAYNQEILLDKLKTLLAPTTAI